MRAKVEAPTLEHIVPVVRLGPTTKENVVPACLTCNCSKGDKDLRVWLWEK